MNITTLIDNFESALREEARLNNQRSYLRVSDTKVHEVGQHVDAAKRELVAAFDDLRGKGATQGHAGSCTLDDQSLDDQGGTEKA